MRFVEPDTGLLSSREKRKITLLRRDLLLWFPEYGRKFPWRSHDSSTFEHICVEVLLQRTRAETVAAIYPEFFKLFKSWSDIANAPTSLLEEQLKPIGLWRRRALSIKGLASYAAQRDGIFPRDTVELAEVPGVGQYVMNAIFLFQHGENRPLVDVNMARVLERFIRPRILADIRYDPWLQAASHWLVRERPIETNWAVLDFAATVCTARGPSCETCFVTRRCHWVHRRARRP